MKIFEKLPHFDFMKWKGLALSISWGIIVLCFLWVRPWNASHVKLGMQFIGGNDMTVRFAEVKSPEPVRQALADAGFPGASVVAYGSSAGVQDFAIKVKARQGGDLKDSTKQSDELRAVFRKMDQGALPSLNLEGPANLADRLIKANPLAAPGDAEALKAVYQPMADRLVSGREKLPAGIYRNFDELPSDVPSAVRDLVKKEYRTGGIAILKNESFSPSISGEWTAKTLKAVFGSMALILLYVMFRFTTSFAIGGIVALVHDLLMALGLFALFGYEFNVPVVASFLTLLGYSMADTIVVFDRIRENSHKPEYRRRTVSDLVNDSINQTLSRTILTSCSVLFVSMCLWLLGGPALKDLAFPLVVGVITGTYSSIYIASPVVVYWEKWFPSKENLKQKHA
ncbi:MAG TPA: protein translocase subunit SecF [Holophagaceae bacterium]|nr:protein translocase subunit SecF [Holophagaceae bacterium]